MSSSQTPGGLHAAGDFLRASAAPAAPMLAEELTLGHAATASEQGEDADGAELELPATDEMDLGAGPARSAIRRWHCEGQTGKENGELRPSCSGRPGQEATSLLEQVRVRPSA